MSSSLVSRVRLFLALAAAGSHLVVGGCIHGCIDVGGLGCIDTTAVRCIVPSAMFASLAALSDAATIVSLVSGLTTAAAVTTKATGLRLGPARALALALRSRVFGVHTLKLRQQSQRATEVANLRKLLADLPKETYIVVSGPKGVGKSCIVASATRSMNSVVAIRVEPGTLEKDIVNAGLRAINGDFSLIANPLPSARRVLTWHNFFLRSPVLVMEVSEVRRGSFAEMTGATRALANMGIRVVLDASDHSLEPGTTATNREKVLEVGVMTRNVVMAITEFKDLFDSLDNARLSDTVWSLAGGNPSVLYQLIMELTLVADKGAVDAAQTLLEGEDKAQKLTEVTEVVGQFLKKRLMEAISTRNKMLAANPKFKNLIQLYQTQDEVPEKFLREKKLVLPPSNKVLRVATGKHFKDENVLVPADPFLAFALRHDLKRAPSIGELRQMTKDGGDGTDNDSSNGDGQHEVAPGEVEDEATPNSQNTGEDKK